MYSCFSRMGSRILSLKASIICRLIFDDTPQIVVQRCKISAPRWSNEISSAADNAIFKNRAQNVESSFGCVERSAVLLKPNFANILLVNFCEQKFVQHDPIMLIIVCKPITPLDKNPHQTVTCFGCGGISMYAYGFSVPQTRQFCLLTYPPRSK